MFFCSGDRELRKREQSAQSNNTIVRGGLSWDCRWVVRGRVVGVGPVAWGLSSGTIVRCLSGVSQMFFKACQGFIVRGLSGPSLSGVCQGVVRGWVIVRDLLDTLCVCMHLGNSE